MNCLKEMASATAALFLSVFAAFACTDAEEDQRRIGTFELDGFEVIYDGATFIAPSVTVPTEAADKLTIKIVLP